MKPSERPDIGRAALRTGALAAVYFVSGKLGLDFTYLGDEVTLIWPPSGIALAALVLWGWRFWPGVWIGAFLVQMTTPASAAVSAAVATGNAVAVAGAAAWLRTFPLAPRRGTLQRRGFDPELGRVRDLLALAACGLVAAPLVASAVRVLTLAAAGTLLWREVPEQLATWMAGDAAGVLVIAPLLLAWHRLAVTASPWGDRGGKPAARRRRQAGALAAALVGIGALVWGPAGGPAYQAPLVFLVFPLLLWAALAFGVRGAAAAIAATAAIAVWRTAGGAGPFVRTDALDTAVLLWTFLAAAAVSALAAAVLFERYRASAALAESEERLMLALEGSEDGIWDWNLTTHKMAFNERWAAMLGYRLTEVEPSWEGWIQLVHPDDAAGVKKALEAHLTGKIPVYQTEHRMRDRSGHWRWVVARGKVVERDERGQPLRMSGTHKDVTERKLAREAQVRSEALIRAILETAPDGVVTFNSRGVIESFNAAAERVFGYSAAEILGKDIRELVPEGERDRGSGIFAGGGRLRSPGRTQELVGRRRDGTTFPLEVSLGEVQLRDHRLYTGLMRDITARKEAEESLKLFRSMVEHTGEGVQLARTRDEVIVYANPALEKMFGYEVGELIGQRVGTIYAADEQGTAAFLRQMTEALTRDGSWRGEARARRKGGSVFWCRIRTSTFKHPKFGEVWVSVHEDITERVRGDEERRMLEDQLRQAHRMESIGQLAGGAAHEFNNLLVVIGGHLGFALGKVAPAAAERRDLEAAQAAVGRAAALAQKLLAFSRRQVLDPVDADLRAVVRELMPMLRAAVAEHIALVLAAGEEPGVVRVDVGQIEQVVLNLCVNARDAMSGGGRITLRVENVDLDDEHCRQRPWARPGSYVMLAVEDTGRGMDEATLRRIFEPFFTTKKDDAATGLGLAMVHGVVQQHRALLDVESRPGEGTAFRIYWPRVDRRAASRPPARTDADVRAGTGLVILAEDDDTVRNVAQRLLEDAGYTVLAAENGEEALRLFEVRAGEVDLVILDLVMPVMGGLATRDEILKLRAETPILLASGYSDAPIHRGPDGVEIPLLAKPFDRRTLLARVRELLGGETVAAEPLGAPPAT